MCCDYSLDLIRVQDKWASLHLFARGVKTSTSQLWVMPERNLFPRGPWVSTSNKTGLEFIATVRYICSRKSPGNGHFDSQAQ